MKSRINLGSLSRTIGQLPSAEDHYHNALRLLENLPKDVRDMPEFQRLSSGCYSNLGLILSDFGRLKDSELHYSNALLIQERLVRDFP